VGEVFPISLEADGLEVPTNLWKRLVAEPGLRHWAFNQRAKVWPLLLFFLASAWCLNGRSISTNTETSTCTQCSLFSTPDLSQKFPNLFNRDPKCPRFGNGKWGLFLEGLGSAEYAFRSLTTNVLTLAEHVDLRDGAETPRLSFSGSLRLALIADNGFSIRSGFQYTQVNEKLSYLNENAVRTIIKEIFDEQGNVIGTDTIIEIGSRYKVTHNRYRTLEIPMLLGYEFKSRATTFYLNGGALINLIAWQKGDILSPADNQPVSIDSDSPTAFPGFKQQLGIGWYGSAGLVFSFSQNLELLIEPYVKSYFQPWTTEQYEVNQQYINAGLFIGLRTQL